MAAPDPVLDSLQDELRTVLDALNRLHHPVYPGDPGRIAELEREVAELRAVIAARKRSLRSVAG
jgi:hypothetical protein